MEPIIDVLIVVFGLAVFMAGFLGVLIWGKNACEKIIKKERDQRKDRY